MIDSHAHIYLDQFDEDRNEVFERLAAVGVKKVFMPNIDSTSIDAMMKLELSDKERYPAMMGLHPCSVGKDFEKDLYEVEDWLNKRSFIAVGEMGTDLYWDKTFWPQQQEAFKIQCELALKHQLPIVIHSRESIDESISLVRPYAERGLRGVFHCFTGTSDQAKAIKDLGFYLGIGGVCTFKNSGLDETLKEIGAEKVLLETDSPYLAPVPYRGKRNEPSYLELITQKLGDIFGMETEEIAATTEKYTLELFKGR